MRTIDIVTIGIKKESVVAGDSVAHADVIADIVKEFLVTILRCTVELCPVNQGCLWSSIALFTTWIRFNLSAERV